MIQARAGPGIGSESEAQAPPGRTGRRGRHGE